MTGYKTYLTELLAGGLALGCAIQAQADTASGPAARPVPAFSTAGFFSLPDSPRSVIDFDPGWRFLKADAPGAEKPGFDDANWEAANLPHSLEILGENASGCRNYQGPAWYRKRFQTASPDGGQKFFLYFEAVMGKAAVWVNGEKVAEHFGGYLPFAAEISRVLRPAGQDNVIAVRADNSDDPAYPPGKPQNDLDFTYQGGIYRDVYLIHTGPVHVTLTELSATPAGGGIFVGVKDVTNNDAWLEVRTEIANDSAAPRPLTLRTILETAGGRELLRQEQSMELAPGASRQVAQELEPKNVHLWFPNDPCLHFIRTEVLEEGKIVDSLRTRFGIRLFEMRGPAGMFVNKQFIGAKLSGANRHQDYAYVGNALPNSGQWRDAKLLRQGGCNVIRAAHYPPDPAFLDACDELGLLVTTANPGWQFFNTQDPLFEKRLYQDTRNLVRRDRNRPSLFLWETVINEEPSQPERALKTMNRVAHQEFPFPGLFTVGDIPEARKGGLDFYYAGNVLEVGADAAADQNKNSFRREYGDGEQVDNFYSHNAPVRVKRDWGEAPLLGQALIRARDLDDIVFSTPAQHVGAALWCGIDHQRGYHPDPFWGGLLDEFRIPRYSYYLFQSQYNADFTCPGIKTGPMIYITHELTQVSGNDVVIFSNCQEVRLKWLGKVLGPRPPDAGYAHLPHPPFTFTNAFDFHLVNTDWRMQTRTIEMTVEGLIGGKVVASQVKKYPERTTALKLTVDDAGIGLTADGSDLVPVRATIVDNKGVPKVLAEEYVRFEVEGPAEIIGGAFNQANPVKTEFGTATLLIRARTTPGLIRIKASAKGLIGDETQILSVAPPLELGFDAEYAASSKAPETGDHVPLAAAPRQPMPETVHQLQLELTSKTQDAMEQRNKVVR